MLKKISFTINGKKTDLEINAGETLLEVLREKLHLTGAKQGCGVGECGACTVLVDGATVNSCLYLGIWADGKNIITVEGLEKNGELSKVQQAFISEGAVQCGFCIPGFVISTTALIDKEKACTHADIKEGLSGNFCRCRAAEKALENKPASDGGNNN